MGRRALPRIDPSLDLVRYLKTWDELPRPWDATALFGRTAPLEVEVGSGKGMFLQSAASGTPDHNFLGVEIAENTRAFARPAWPETRSATPSWSKATPSGYSASCCPTLPLTAVHVYFPDPWWKKRHHKRRVMNESFVRDVARTPWRRAARSISGPTSKITSTLRSPLSRLKHRLVGPLSVAERPAEHDLDFRTHFERRMRLLDEPVYRAEFYAGR